MSQDLKPPLPLWLPYSHPTRGSSDPASFPLTTYKDMFLPFLVN